MDDRLHLSSSLPIAIAHPSPDAIDEQGTAIDFSSSAAPPARQDEDPAVTLPLALASATVKQKHQHQQKQPQPQADCPRNNFKYCVRSISRRRTRAKKSNHLPDRFVIGWPDDEAQDVSYSMFRPFWEKIRNDLVDSAYDHQDPLFNVPPSIRKGCCQNIWDALPTHHCHSDQEHEREHAHGFYSPSSGQSDSDDRSITSSSLLRTVKTASISGTSSSRVSTADRPPTIGTCCAEPVSFTAAVTATAIPSTSGHAAPTTRTSRKRTSVESASSAGCRDSICSSFRNSLSLDEAAWNRAVQRRQILKELVETESTYVIGLKALADVGHTTTSIALHCIEKQGQF